MNPSRKTLLLVSIFVYAYSLSAKDYIVTLGNPTEKYLSIDLLGGAFTDFRISKQSDNPFSWSVSIKDMPENNRHGARFQGHFMCLGRWGAPTEGEMKAGVPHNGEAGNKLWKVISLKEDSALIICSNAPLDGLNAQREIWFDKTNGVFKVTDDIESTLSVGRLFNVVQHATLGTPFLAESTLINSNATNGFMQHLAYPDPHLYEYKWPNAIIDTVGNRVDLTKTDVPQSYVSTHLFEDRIGWITASNSQNGLLIGYVWDTEDYPWLNLWHEMKDGKPCAKGLEFGTAGIGLSYQKLLVGDTRFHGVNSFFYLDALEHFKKSFICFQIYIPVDFRGVAQLKMESNRILLIEKETKREIVIKHHYNLK